MQDGTAGKLGNGGNSSQLSPVPVSGGHTFNAIAAGDDNTCALNEAGALWCWGWSTTNGQTDDTNVPVELDGGHTFVAVSAGSVTCGLDTLGDVWCFGRFAETLAPAHTCHGCPVGLLLMFCWLRRFDWKITQGCFAPRTIL